MAKTGFWLKGANGKLAGATIYQQNGETVMREVVSPTNPKTEKQIIQRIIMHTVMQSYSKMKEICDHSFEGQKKGQATMSYYMQQNVQLCRQQVASMQADGVDFYEIYNFVPLGVKGFTPNAYQVAMGSLPRIDVALPGDEDSDVNKVWIPAITTANPTYQDIIDALHLQRGDQLTFLIIRGVEAGRDQFGQNEFIFCRIILDPIDPVTHLQLPLSTAFLGADGAINAPSFRNENTDAFGFAYSNADQKFKFGSATPCIIVAACVIASRQVSGNWQRSTTFLQYRGNFGLTYSLGECMDSASKGVQNAVYAPSELYLNNAGQGGGQAANTGENSGAGGNGGASSEVTVDGASIGGIAMVVGTTYPYTAAALPASVALHVGLSNAPAGTSVSVKGSNNASAEDIVSESVSNGGVDITHNFAAGTYYLFYNVDGEDVATGFSFSVAQSSGGSGGGDFDPGT